MKDLENHQRIYRKYWLKCSDLQKIFISWPFPFKSCRLGFVGRESWLFYQIYIFKFLIQRGHTVQQDQACSWGGILGRNKDKIWTLLLHAITSHLHQWILLSPWFSWTWDLYSSSSVESGWGLGFVYMITLFTLESSIILSLITLYLKKQTIRNDWKEENLTESKPYHPIKKTQVCTWIAFCGKLKLKVET